MTITVADLADVVTGGLCIGCGFCTLPLTGSSPTPPVRIAYNENTDSYTPVIDDALLAATDQRVVCPGLEMDMLGLSEWRFGSQPNDSLVGTVIGQRVGFAAAPAVRAASASGGIVPTLLSRLFDDDRIDVAYVVDAGNHVRDAHGCVLTEAASLTRCHGSVYHPVDFGRDLLQLVDSGKRFAFVGLPCEVAALEMYKQHRPDVAERHVISIGLFCGGINAFSGIAYYLQGFGIQLSARSRIDYRVGDWPGRIQVTGRDEPAQQVPRIQGNSRWKILRYVAAFQGYWMLPRCRMCPDQIADFADVAVGDPHLPRFKKQRSAGHSIVLTRTAAGESLVQDVLARGSAIADDLSRAELVASQGYTLDNRRHVAAYLHVAKRLGRRTPMLKVYSPLALGTRARHFVYAWVDMLKVQLRPFKSLRRLYVPIQAFEYAFITLAPSLVLRRIVRLFRNR